VQKPEGVSGILWGFAHVALLKELHYIPLDRREERRQAVERFLEIKSDDDCRRFINDVRERVRQRGTTAGKARVRSRAKKPPDHN